MIGEHILQAAKKQQQLTGKQDADVSFLVKGSWPAKGERKRLFLRSGPYGHCVAEYEDSVLCVFKANEVIEAVEKVRSKKGEVTDGTGS